MLIETDAHGQEKKREYNGLRKKYAVEAHEKISLTIHVTVY